MKSLLAGVVLLLAAGCATKGTDGEPLVQTNEDRLALGQIVYEQVLETAYRWETSDVSDVGKGLDSGIAYLEAKLEYEIARAEAGGVFTEKDLDNLEEVTAAFRRHNPVKDERLNQAFDVFEVAYEVAKLALGTDKFEFNEATVLKLLKALREYEESRV